MKKRPHRQGDTTAEPNMVRSQPASEVPQTGGNPLPTGVLRAAAIVLCWVWLTGCMPAFLSKKTNSVQDSGNGGKVELIKPQMDASPTEDATENAGAAESVTGPSGNDSKSSEPSGSTKEDSGYPSESSEFPQESSGRDKQPSAKAEPDKGAVQDASADKIDPAAKEVSSDTRSEKVEVGVDAPLRKHDHSRYVNLIRSKAIDQLNQDKDADFVQLCRNTTTDQWSLTIYYRMGRTYSFADYAWDEIGLKWEKVFSSGNRPITGWNRHLDFTSALKECKVLKGSRQKW